ncbi:tyrosine-type recombinase/integrase [Georgenia muralis]
MVRDDGPPRSDRPPHRQRVHRGPARARPRGRHRAIPSTRCAPLLGVAHRRGGAPRRPAARHQGTQARREGSRAADRGPAPRHAQGVHGAGPARASRRGPHPVHGRDRGARVRDRSLGPVRRDLTAGTAIVRRGKGGKGRVVPFGPQTARAIDRYKRRRAGHRLASTQALWLGDRGKGFTYDALYKALTHRARVAGLTGFHPHQLRHTAAHRWLAAGGSEGGLMAVAGWTRPDMLTRYTKARASERAAAEARALNLGDL